MKVSKRQLTVWSHELREGDNAAGRGLAAARWGQGGAGPATESDDELDRAKTIAILMVVLALFSRAV